MIKTLTAIAFSLLLSACGGGGDPEELDACLYVKWQSHTPSAPADPGTCATDSSFEVNREQRLPKGSR